MTAFEEKILLVDDEPRVLSGLRRRLSGRFDILTAESADEAIRILASGETVGAILADMRMPGRDGVDLLMEAERRWPNIRRLMLTGNTDQDTAIAAVNRGRVCRFFRKPCDTDELALALAEALQEYRFVTEAQTERRILERKAQSGDRARRSFLSTMSHELLTPLNHMIGFTSMLELKLQHTDENEAMEYLGHIKDSGESLLQMVRRVLEMSRLMSEELRHEKEIVDVAAIIREEIEKLRALADERGVGIAFQTAPEPYFAELSGHELRFALRELLDNAVKYNNPGGHVSVAVGASPEWLTVRIADNGMGIAEDAIERARGLLSEAPDCDVVRFGGLGLGLSFVMLFARANDGAIEIESSAGEGTAIMLTLARAGGSGLQARSA
ncbi:MAG: hybrid sensor histidine kinase/response regulator [Rhodomicrobium sp.]|nr:hybrid sensor histidine kinase/response regulator [Rhodomicrobium sp.]